MFNLATRPFVSLLPALRWSSVVLFLSAWGCGGDDATTTPRQTDTSGAATSGGSGAGGAGTASSGAADATTSATTGSGGTSAGTGGGSGTGKSAPAQIT